MRCGKPIVNERQKTVNVFTKPDLESERRQMTDQVAVVNLIFAFVAGFCGGGREVIFRKHVGKVSNLKTSERTLFGRVGNGHVVDAYILNLDYVPRLTPRTSVS